MKNGEIMKNGIKGKCDNCISVSDIHACDNCHNAYNCKSEIVKAIERLGYKHLVTGITAPISIVHINTEERIKSEDIYFEGKGIGLLHLRWQYNIRFLYAFDLQDPARSLVGRVEDNLNPNKLWVYTQPLEDFFISA